ncbi:superoxide dismutase family protein [Streptomyces scopuliridis]|uniref:Copper/zinc superoxide dismutase (SODC) n=2 Tax=Streptomyces scopuliridis TaxID=452529 RepID=A0A2T7TAH7_9ACTN|nr:superoxide dismutase family protein [Streptomyces scopuliridis]PVE12157.1 Copper/zinc superoxide dismutase (SODC) [Streptomyces scopuliridis RB72]WSC01959.1 superoxide dismutase family protein [Streptomyces scopuliridis]WSC04504.1 superoxide dismutase family protein [Streptomyces scopuliridis]
MTFRSKTSVSAVLAVTALLAMPPMVASAQGGGSPTVWAEGRFLAPSPYFPPDAVTYDRKVPVGAHVTVVERTGARTTGVGLAVSGLVPNRMYGAHVHTKPCGRAPEDAGPHYQHIKDPHQPSTDPAYANAANEVWLDFTTDVLGRAVAESTHDWGFRRGEARSVVIHDHGTMTDPGEAGTAGARLACLTVPFV